MKSEEEIEKKIKYLLSALHLTAFQRLKLKKYRPDIYAYLPKVTLSSETERCSTIQFLKSDKVISDEVENYLDEYGDLFSTRYTWEMSNWQLQRRRYAQGQ